MEELTSDPTNYSETEQNWLSQMQIDTAGLRTNMNYRVKSSPLLRKLDNDQKHSFPIE